MLRESIVGVCSDENQSMEDVVLDRVFLGRCCEIQSVDDVLLKAVF